MSENLWLVPARLKEKKSFFGNIDKQDIVASGILIGIGVLFAITTSALVGLAAIALFGGVAYITFIMKDGYNENARIRIQRALAHNKRQKVYYYYRGDIPEGLK